MKNPLNKRILRELKSDVGKYLVIFLFMAMLISLVSGFLVSDNSMRAGYDEGFIKYNIEDGHIAFDKKPGDTLLEELEKKDDLKFYDLSYFEEEVEDSTSMLRVYKNREEVNLASMWDGKLPENKNEIAIDRMYADNNDLSVGDTVTLHGRTLDIVGLIAVPDYSCLFENNTDMMFDSINFGVGVMTPEGYDDVESAHITYNYAWKYNTPYEDDKEADERSEKFLDDLEDVLTDYDIDIIQAQIDDLYDDAKVYEKELENEFEDASDVCEDRLENAYEDAAEKAMDTLGSEEILDCLLDESGISETRYFHNLSRSVGLSREQLGKLYGMSSSLSSEELIATLKSMAGLNDEQFMEKAIEATGLNEEDAATALMEKAAKSKNTTVNALLAAELGTDEDKLEAMLDSFEDFEDETADLKDSVNSGKVSLEDLDESKDYENEMEFDLSPVHDLVEKVKAVGICDTADIEETLDELEALMDFEIDDTGIISVDDYVPRYENQAINFTGDDMGSDKSMFVLFDYIVTAIIAFVFAVTISNTISKEAGVIGTLRASGYTRGEMVRHYLVLPVSVTLVAAVIGNIIGYTVLADVFTKVYLGSYSLADCGLLFNADAFMTTTVVPIILMFVINLFVLEYKLQLSPLKFLRHDLQKKSKKKALRLNSRIPFMHRFRLRILIQNIPAYLVLFVGLFLGGMVIIFGLMFGPLLNDYADLVKESEISKYQYVLIDQKETENKQAEKYCVTSLDTIDEGYMTDSVTIYGIEDESSYVKTAINSGEVLINNGFADKFGLEPGDEVTLKDKYEDKDYTFKIQGVYTYDAAISMFMPRKDYIDTFGEDEDYFSGYFSNEELTDIEEDDIATVITEDDLSKIADQLLKSMGEFMSLFKVFGVIMFLLLMYIMTKQIIEKNMQSIAMTKILGFSGGEIGGLYLVITSLVVIVSLFVTIPLVDAALRWAFKSYIYTMMTGYIPYIVSNQCYVKMVVLGIVSYIVICACMMIKINKIPMSDALKNVE